MITSDNTVKRRFAKTWLNRDSMCANHVEIVRVRTIRVFGIVVFSNTTVIETA